MANKEEEKANIEEVKPITYNLRPEVLQKNKKLERLNASLGNVQPTKAKLTNLTFTSCKDNLESDAVEKIFDSLNANIEALRDKITKEAYKKAEEEAKREVNAEEAMNSMTDLAKEETNNNKPMDRKKTENILALKLETTVAKASNPENVDPILNNNKMLLTKTNKYELEFEDGKLPKAIMIPALLMKSIAKIGGNINRYTNSEGASIVVSGVKDDERVVINSDQSSDLQKVVEKKKQPKWRNAFNIELEKEKNNVAKNDLLEIMEESIPKNVPVVDDSKITPNELRERKTLAEAGESLSEIKRLEDGIGAGKPFNEGLETRKRELRKIIGDITGTTLPDTIKTAKKVSNTKFQSELDMLLGVKPAPTKEEHNANQEKYEEYFNDPDFIKQTERQRLEGILFDLNTPEFAESIDRAERKDNERIALLSQQTNMEIIGDEVENNKENNKMTLIEKPVEKEVKPEPKKNEKKPVESTIDSDLNKYGLYGKKVIKKMHVTNLLADGAKEQAEKLFEENQKVDLINGAEEQAKLLYNLNKIALGAELQAKELFNKNQKADLINGAEEQAKLLLESNKEEDLIKESAQKEAERLNTLNMIADGAEEQAKLLYDLDQNKIIKESAQKEAERLNTLNMIADGAEEQAKLLLESNKEEDLIKESAQKEAERLNTLNMIADGAEEQAKLLYDLDKNRVIKESAQKEAERLNTLNMIADGAEEQAKILAENNKILESAEIQARMIFNNDTQTKLREDAKTQAQLLFEKNQMIDAQRVAESKKNEVERVEYEFTDARSKYAEIIDYSKPIKLVGERYNNLYKNTSNKYASKTSYKDTLVSLRDELTNLVGEEDYSEQEHMKMVA